MNNMFNSPNKSKQNRLFSPSIEKKLSVFTTIFILLFVGFGCKYLKPKPPDIEDYKQELITAIRRADDAEIEATRKNDKAPLATAYKGEALLTEEKGIDNLNEQDIYAESKLEDQEFESFKFLEDGKKAEVRVIETWSSVYYNKADGKCVSVSPTHKLPQTIVLEKDGDTWFVVAIVHDLNKPDPELTSCEASTDPANTTAYNDNEAGISYELPTNWKVEDKGRRKSFTSADKNLIVFINISESKDAESDLKTLSAKLKDFIKNPKITKDTEEYTIDGMRAIRFSGTGMSDGKNVDWGVNLIDSGKAVMIFHIANPGKSADSMVEFQAFLDSIKKL